MEKLDMKCVGCDAAIPWDGRSLFAYTCPCGATVFYDSDMSQIAMPASVVLAMAGNRPLPHLEFLIGESRHTSEIKDRVRERFIEKGAIWMKDCERCLNDGTYQKKLDRDKKMAISEAERICRYGSV